MLGKHSVWDTPKTLFRFLKILYYVCGCACVHTCSYAHRHALAITHVWRSENNFQESALSYIMWVLRIKFSGQAWQQGSLSTGPTLQPSNLITFCIKFTIIGLYILIKSLNRISRWMSFLKLCVWRFPSHRSTGFPFLSWLYLLPWRNLWTAEWVVWHIVATFLIIWSVCTWGCACVCIETTLSHSATHSANERSSPHQWNRLIQFKPLSYREPFFAMDLS